MCPAAVTQITYFHAHVFIDQRASLMLFDLKSLICLCCLLTFILIVLCLYPLLHLVLLYKVLLDLSSEVAIIEELILLCVLINGHIR